MEKTPGFQQLKTLVVIRDAEKNADGAVKSVISAFRQSELPVPSSPGEIHTGASLATGFLLFPSCNNQPENGTLEDLCLSILEKTDAQAFAEIIRFVEHLKTQGIRSFPHEFKSKLHTYFSITDDYVSLKLGEAAKAGAFDWTSSALTPLRNFLIEMTK